MKKQLCFLAVSLLVGVILTELTLCLFFPIWDPCEDWKSRRSDLKYIESQFSPYEEYVFYPEAELPLMDGEIRFSVNNMGFRGPDIATPKPPDEYRIFMVGGSTTECLYLDDSRTVTSTLQAFLDREYPGDIDFKVYNAGKGGDKTFDHIAMISHRIVHLEPDMIILFAGLNDLLAAIGGVDYTHLPEITYHRCTFIDAARYFLTEFQIPRYVWRIFTSPSDEDIMQAIPFHSHYKRQIGLAASYPPAGEPPQMDLTSYATNMRSIIGIARANNIRLVLMTQATTWNSEVDSTATDWHWMNACNGQRYRETDMDRAMEAYNDVTRQLAEEYQVPLLDLAKMIPKSRNLIYDDCHFNINGAHVAGTYLGQMLVDRREMIEAASAGGGRMGQASDYAAGRAVRLTPDSLSITHSNREPARSGK